VSTNKTYFDISKSNAESVSTVIKHQAYSILKTKNVHQQLSTLPHLKLKIPKK